jgi:hypothetical protein
LAAAPRYLGHLDVERSKPAPRGYAQEARRLLLEDQEAYGAHERDSPRTLLTLSRSPACHASGSVSRKVARLRRCLARWGSLMVDAGRWLIRPLMLVVTYDDSLGQRQVNKLTSNLTKTFEFSFAQMPSRNSPEIAARAAASTFSPKVAGSIPARPTGKTHAATTDRRRTAGPSRGACSSPKAALAGRQELTDELALAPYADDCWISLAQPG